MEISEGFSEFISAFGAGLLLTEGLGARLKLELYSALLNRGSSEPDDFDAFLAPSVLAGLKRSKVNLNVEDLLLKGSEYLSALKNTDISYLTLGTHEYPHLLAEIPDPPLLLFYRGLMPSRCNDCVAVVGTRAPNPAGEGMAWKLGAALADAGASVVSGMARGVDSLAHHGCLERGGTTVAVLGTGVDVIYPAENISLSKKIIENGTIVSEFLPGTTARPSHFPRRNRIISGLSYAVVIVQASIRSGSLITGRLGLEQGREILAFPGDVCVEQYQGNNHVIRNGEARLVRSPADVIEDVNMIFSLQKTGRHLDTGDSCGNNRVIPADGSNPSSKADHLTGLIRDGDTIDVLVRRSNLNVSEVLTVLSELEMIGRIKRRGDGAIFISGLGRFE
ncbi:MAG: DNA-protecting protein DprA [Candidatus Wallbacteria bacterium HGW-Wallbacteria-1]|uniref:DNA-protecting protein DprA n=1 Tax=Candidatus Wallbacteria bacterium HGW-Wallbacteria-1 TaxID=2013854 RepID=A0A2N1PSS2_9BACT|nr:MAG: DNA-protecting protein DprA [Candidatus Wallbacteria bacterium HGW-Wallbacteria-1]